MMGLWDRLRDMVTWTRTSYVVGLVTSGAMGHCVAIASVVPRVEVVEARVEELGAAVAHDRRVLDRVEGMVEGVAIILGVDVPPPVPPSTLEAIHD